MEQVQNEGVVIKCNGEGCNKSKTVESYSFVKFDEWFRSDAYGIPTGLYCGDCYKNNYPYKRDRYEHDEDLEPEEY